MVCKFIPSPINAGAITMVGGLIIVPIVSALTPKLNNVFINDIFSCYEKTVVVHRKHSLEDDE